MNFWKNITKILSPKKSDEWTAQKDAVYFHEDLYRQVEFCPRENFKYLNEQNQIIGQFAKEHSDGIGFTDVYERGENPISIWDKNIPIQPIDEILTDLDFEKITKVYEGYGSTSWRCKNTFAYRLDQSVVFIHIEGQYVKDFWIDGFRFEKNEDIKAKLKKGISQIGIEFDLILNDWDLTEIIDLKNELQIDKYLNEDL